MKIPYKHPEYQSEAFNCPHCKAYANMNWERLVYGRNYLQNSVVTHCTRCDEFSIWISEVMIYPAEIQVEDPNPDIPDDIKEDYIEAAEILSKSPRGAAALLRLVIEKLVDYLEAEGKDLNGRIQWLVNNEGLSVQIQKSLDILRVIGNNAVHPGEINIKDTPEIATALFKLVNLIAEKTITEPKEINMLFDSLPENAKKGITTREEKSKKKQNE